MGEEQGSVIITGASRGIGRQIAIAFSRQTPYPLVLIARSEKGLAQTKELCRTEGENLIAIFPCDLTDPEAVGRIELPEELPSPRFVINNAGSYLYKPLSETSLQEFHEQINVNLYSAVHVTNRFLGELQAQPSALIVNICSEGALVGLKDSGAYAASKHALLGYSRSLREELMPTNVKVTAINLGQTQSTSWEGSSVDPNLLIDPNDVAELILSFCRLSPRTVVEEILVRPQHGRVPPM